jgi:hypothetical protein
VKPENYLKPTVMVNLFTYDFNQVYLQVGAAHAGMQEQDRPLPAVRACVPSAMFDRVREARRA